MPVLTVLGIPTDLRNTDELKHLALVRLPEAASSVPEMKITPDLVTVYVPGDLIDKGLGDEIIVFIEGLFMREERTPEARQGLANAVRDCVVEWAQEHVLNCKTIEVIPRSQRPDDGFANWQKE